MLAQEGSPSRRSSSSTADAAIGGRRRKSRAVSDAGRSRVASQKLPRKYSLSDATAGGVFLVERERERLEVQDGFRATEVFAEGCLLEFDRREAERNRDSQSGRDGQRNWSERDWQWGEKDAQRNQSQRNIQNKQYSERNSCERDVQRCGNDAQRNKSERDLQSSEKDTQIEKNTPRNWCEKDAQRNGSERDTQRSGGDVQRNWSECNSERNSNERVGVHRKVTGVVENGTQVIDRRTEITESIEGITRFGGSSTESVDCGSNGDEGKRLDHQENNVESFERNSYLAWDGERRYSVDAAHQAGNGRSRRNSQVIDLVEIRNQGARNETNDHETWRDVESRFDSLLTDSVGNELESRVTRFSDNRHEPSVNNDQSLSVESEPLRSTRFAESKQNSQLANVVKDEGNTDFTRLGESRHSLQIVGQNSELDDQSTRKAENCVATSSDSGERSATQVNEAENVTPRHRPKSWYAKPASAEEEQAKARRRKTHPGHHADYQEALSSLLWQPYECQRELTTVCSSPDDSDVAYWLGCRLPEFRIPREELELRYRDEVGGSLSSSRFVEQDPRYRDDAGSLSTSRFVEQYRDDGGSLSSSRTTSSLSVGGEVSDREEWLERLPGGALASSQLPVATGCRTGAVVSLAPDAGKNGSDMRAPVVDTAPLPAVVSSSSSAAPVHNSSSNHISNSNSSNNNNNVSLVRCYGAGVASVPSIDCVVASSSSTNPVVRTFTSTEAQTDDVVVDTAAVVRPRERRRHHNRRQQPPVPPTTTPLTDRLPDILNSHLPPPYTTLPPPPPPHLGLPPSIPVLTAVPPPGSPPPPLQHTPAAVSNLVAGLRFPFAIVPAARRR
ncbi:hypothetical protein LSTR_LSTR010895 [Laodelphax striatellus]|uniref:Uncharacterized protein n=1 Tax=Laodelphax striatellus TaxID=195883 RepID=A0A482XK75_LAOST|nr:hypothetical protein LSTR_LSTR010895 [Laodelphax striatellus]